MTDRLPLTCPSCGTVNNAQTGTGPRPKPGDVMVCWSCSHVGVFTGTGIRHPTAAETQEFAEDPDVLAARFAIATQGTALEALKVLGWGP